MDISNRLVTIVPTMRCNIYGRFQLDVQRENDTWSVYRSEQGKRTRLHDVPIPSDLEARELATYLDDIFHEFAKPGETVEAIPSSASGSI